MSNNTLFKQIDNHRDTFFLIRFLCPDWGIFASPYTALYEIGLMPSLMKIIISKLQVLETTGVSTT